MLSWYLVCTIRRDLAMKPRYTKTPMPDAVDGGIRSFFAAYIFRRTRVCAEMFSRADGLRNIVKNLLSDAAVQIYLKQRNCPQYMRVILF